LGFFFIHLANVFRVPVPDCNNEQDKGQQTFSFAVRAVNNNPLDPHRPYYGQWSVPGSVSCVLPGNFQNRYKHFRIKII